MYRLALQAIVTAVLAANCTALERPDTAFQIFQFPPDQIPRIDGDLSDWAIVPDSYAVGADQLVDTVRGHGADRDPKDLDVRVRVGWVKGLNRLYFSYEASDDYWNMYYRMGDVFEVAVDADRSGGEFINNAQLPDWADNHFLFKGVHAQNYHIFTPPGEGRDWTMVWGCQPWIKELPYANHAYQYDFKEGESGRLALEFWITPFDYAPYDGPERAVESKLEENGVIGLSWAVLDYDEDNEHYEGFWNLSHATRMDSNASMQVGFMLMPLEARFRKALEAQWSFKVVDMDRRLVAFKDLSHGAIDSWHWDFDDGVTSAEQHPVHHYEKAGDYTVVLTVKGPLGEARRVKVKDVAVR